MAFLFLASFCLFSVLFCSTLYCVPIESIGNVDIGESGVDWKHGSYSDYSGLRVPGIFGNLAEICRSVSHARIQKLICLFCKGFDISCFLQSPATTPLSFPTVLPISTTSTTTTTSSPTTSVSTTSVSTTTVTTTTPAVNITTTPTTAAKSDIEEEEE